MLDRVAASTRLLNAHSVHYIGMIIAAHLTEVCRQKVKINGMLIDSEFVILARANSASS
jgi:hypothetical protein